MQFGFTPGRGTKDVIFTLRQLQRIPNQKEEFLLSTNKLGKAFDRVPRDNFWLALRKVGTEEQLVRLANLEQIELQ